MTHHKFLAAMKMLLISTFLILVGCSTVPDGRTSLPTMVLSTTPSANETTAVTVGRMTGDLITTAQGVSEMGTGGGIMGGGVAVCLTGVGCLATPVAVVAGATAVVHGSGVLVSSARGLGENLANMTSMGSGGSNNSSYYKPGKPYTRSELEEMGATSVRTDKKNVTSPDFKEFIRSQGQSFRYNEWNKVMETWQLPDGTEIENHYWRHKSGATWYHD